MRLWARTLLLGGEDARLEQVFQLQPDRLRKLAQQR